MFDYPSQARRANRRRLIVFLGVFLVGSAIGLAWALLRPPQYLASARAQINPGSVQVETTVQTGAALGTDAPRSLLTEIQVLTSRPVIEATLAQLPQALREKAAALGADPAGRLQQWLDASPAEGSSVVRITATGGDPALAAGLVNGVIATYTQKLAEAYQRTASDAVAQASEEVSKLEAKVAAKQREVEAFRVRYDIVSLEGRENEAMISARGLAASAVAANEKAATAEGKRRAIEESIAAGRPIVNDRANAVLENLEQRASQIREDLSALHRRYTDSYLAIDPNVRAQGLRLAELERQIAQQRTAMRSVSGTEQQAAIAAAREEATAARDTAVRIQQQLSTNRAGLQQFTTRLNEYRALNDELAPLQALLRDAIQRKARLDAGERGRRPWVQIIEAAKVPSQAWRPLYARDSAIVVAAAFLLALLAMWVVEIFNRTDPVPTMLVSQPMPLAGIGYAPGARAALPGQASGRLAYGGADAGHVDAAPGGLLAGPRELPRELADTEVTALLEAADGATRAVALLILSGASAEELAALRRDDIDLDQGTVRIGGAAPRTLELPAPVLEALAKTSAFAGASMFGEADGRSLDSDALASALVFAAHDARLAHPIEVTTDALRHTFVINLVRQGIRMADLARIAGKIAPEFTAAYVNEAPAGKLASLDQVERVLPGIRAARLA